MNAPLRRVRTPELDDIRSPPAYRRIDAVYAIRAKHDEYRHFASAKAINALDQRIHASAVFVVHLLRLPTLCECVCFVEQKNRYMSCPSRLGFDHPEGARNLSGHVADDAGSTRLDTHAQEADGLSKLARNGISK